MLTRHVFVGRARMFACALVLAVLCVPTFVRAASTSADGAPMTLPEVAPQEGDGPTTLAQSFWRSMVLSQGTTRRDYREPDPLGRVNLLNSETGSVPTTLVTVRWRGQVVKP